MAAYDVAQFSTEQRHPIFNLLDEKRYPLPKEYEPECPLDDLSVYSKQIKPALLLVEFDQVLGQTILLTFPTLLPEVLAKLNKSLEVIFGVNYQEVNAATFTISPECTAIFPDLTFPAYIRYFTVYDADGRGLVRNCCLCFVANNSTDLYSYIPLIENHFNEFLKSCFFENIYIFWKQLLQRLYHLYYTKDVLTEWQCFQNQSSNIQATVEPPDSITSLSNEELHILKLSDHESLESNIVNIKAAIQVIKSYISTNSNVFAETDFSEDFTAHVFEKKIIKMMSINASDPHRKVAPLWSLFGFLRTEILTEFAKMLQVVEEYNQKFVVNIWSPSFLLTDVIEKLCPKVSVCLNVDRPRTSTTVTTHTNEYSPGTLSFLSADSFTSAKDCNLQDANSESSSESTDFYSRQSSIVQPFYALSAKAAFMQPIFPQLLDAQHDVLKFLSIFSLNPTGVTWAVISLLKGKHLVLYAKSSVEGRKHFDCLKLFVPHIGDPPEFIWLEKLTSISQVHSNRISVVHLPNTNCKTLPVPKHLRNLTVCLSISTNLYSGPAYQAGVFDILLQSKITEQMCFNQQFATHILDIVFADLAEVTLNVLSLESTCFIKRNKEKEKIKSINYTKIIEAKTELIKELQEFGISWDDYLIGQHLSQRLLSSLLEDHQSQSSNTYSYSIFQHHDKTH